MPEPYDWTRFNSDCHIFLNDLDSLNLTTFRGISSAIEVITRYTAFLKNISPAPEQYEKAYDYNVLDLRAREIHLRHTMKQIMPPRLTENPNL